ncbi:hypothetical protein [Gordonia tangerina]|jgi:hypothetical protein|uniref:Uncharacterized protein n=1 Tax=Gordonia tangerina TaxID=2911060 RepID=A0ABS9DF89_9ACTN|nr:hypothetical protein [Gordonia tangerina]MCF3937768.1 hypothetical protein [Gordonia tangerina]
MGTRTHGRHRLDRRDSRTPQAVDRRRPARLAAWVATGSAPAILAFTGGAIASAQPAPAHLTADIGPHHIVDDDAGTRTGPGSRALPDRPLPTFDPSTLHAPAPTAPVRPITAPPDTVRIGDITAPAPQWLPPEQTEQVNTAAATGEAQIATAGDAVGLDSARSDRVAATTIAGAATGAAVATATVGAPLAVAGGVVGGVAGLVAGVPFLPAGLVVGPPVGAAIGAAATAAPFAAAGAAIGGGVGLAQGLAEPAHP